MYSMTEPLTEYEKQYIQRSTDQAYESFVSKAAEGRSIERSKFEPLASGRIWTGEEALNNGLVDILGNLDDAIEIAAAKSSVADDYAVRVYPVQKAPFEELLESLSGEYETRSLAKKFGVLYPYARSIETLQQLQGVQARSLFRVGF
jgi:protease IV